MSNVRLVLKAIAVVGLDEFYDRFDGVIRETKNIGADHDAEYERLAIVTAKRILYPKSSAVEDVANELGIQVLVL